MQHSDGDTNDDENEVEEYDPFFYHLKFPPYSRIPNERPAWNKRPGWTFS